LRIVVTDQENQELSDESVPSIKWFPALLVVILCAAGFLLWIVIAPQFKCYGCSTRAYDPDTKANLHNVYLACKAYWVDNDSDSVCTHEIAQSTAYGYLKSFNVEIVAIGDESDFFALAYNKKSPEVFKVDEKGAIEKLSDSPKDSLSFDALLFLSKPEHHLRNYLGACKTYWKDIGPSHDCSVENAIEYGFEPKQEIEIIASGKEASFQVSMKLKKDAPHPKEIESMVLLANGKLKTSEDDYSRVTLSRLNLACSIYWKETRSKEPCTPERAAEYGFAAYPDLDLVAGGPEPLYTAFAKHKSSGNVFRLDNGQITQAHFLRLYDRRSGKLLRHFPAVAGTVELTFSMDDKKLIEWNVLRDRPSMHLRDVVTGNYYKTLAIKDTKNLFSSDIRWTFDNDEVSVFTGSKDRISMKIPGLTSEIVLYIAVSHDRKTVAVLSANGDHGPSKKSSILKSVLEYKRNKLIRNAGREIHRAVDRGKYETVEYLLASGADVNASYVLGNTPLHNLPWNKPSALSLAKLLISYGADVNARNKRGETPLHSAFHHQKQFEVMELLVAHGADIKAKTSSGRTVLHYWTSSVMHPELLGLYVDHGGDINAKDIKGNTPLHHLCKYSMTIEKVELLISNGADVKAQNSSGATPCPWR
jgi:hypothetical protein